MKSASPNFAVYTAHTIEKDEDMKSTLSIRTPASPSSDFENTSSPREGTQFTFQPTGSLSLGPLGKLHEMVSAERLKMKIPYSRQTRRVNTETLHNLSIASDTIMDVKARLPYGSGNQTPDVVRTWGESNMRVSFARTRSEGMSRKADREREVHNYATSALMFQAGNCDETASLAYTLVSSQHTLNAPLMLVSDQYLSHEYALLGDPRDPTWGEKQTVVIDPWMQFPSAYTLEEARGIVPGLASIQRAPGTLPSNQAHRALSSVKQASVDAVRSLQQSNEHAPVGEALLQEVLDDDENEKWDERCGAKDPSVRYTDGSSTPRSYDEVPESLLQTQVAALDSIENKLSNKRRGIKTTNFLNEPAF